MFHHIAIVAVACALTATTIASDPPEGTPERYEVRLSRPATVGQRLQVKYEAFQKTTSTPTLGGQRQMTQTNKLHVVFDAVAEVKEIDTRAFPSLVTYTIGNCEWTNDGQKRTIASPGSVITAQLEGEETVFLLDGRPMFGESVQALALVAGLPGPGATHDDLCGSPTPRAPGESWAVNMDNMLAELRRASPVPVTEKQVDGKVTFGDIRDHEGQACMYMDTQFTVRQWLSQLTPGFEIESSEFGATLRGLYPTDVTLPPAMESERVTIKAVVTSPMAAFDLDVVKRIERESTVLAPAEVATAEQD